MQNPSSKPPDDSFTAGAAWGEFLADLMGRTTGYRVTVNRVRDTLPGVVLADRAPRAVAAVALTQYGLVSPGRMFYGMVSGRQVSRVLSRLYRRLGWKDGDFPHAERIGASTITLPLFPAMADHDVDRVCTALQEVLLPALN